MSNFGQEDLRKENREMFFQNEFPGHLLANDDEEVAIKLRPIDVSPRGLGFLTRTELKSGDFFWLVIQHHKIRVEVAYCHAHLGIDNLFRCGLFIREADGNLTSICRDLGLIQETDNP